MDNGSSASLQLLTMCDWQFLPQVLVLHSSMSAAAGREVGLTVLALEPAVSRYLAEFGPDTISVITLEELEALDPDLRATREQRSWVEYCWTATPALCALIVEQAPAGGVVAWLDADVAFLRDPVELLDALGGGSVLLVPHRYYRLYPDSAPAWYLTENWGAYNGGTIAFRNDEEGLAAVRRWREMSIDWCFDRVEPGRFGNQKHLTDFATRFEGARVMTIPGGCLGPWNAGQFGLDRGSDGSVRANGQVVLAYHYQSLRLYQQPRLLRLVPRPISLMRMPGSSDIVARTKSWYRLGYRERRLFWRPYLRTLAVVVNELDSRASFIGGLDTLRTIDLRADHRQKIHLTWRRVRHRIAPGRAKKWYRPGVPHPDNRVLQPEQGPPV